MNGTKRGPVTVLITGVGAPSGISALKALRLSRLPIRIIGVDADPRSVGFFFADIGIVVPHAGREFQQYQDALGKICRQESVSLVFFGSEPEMRLMAPEAETFEKEYSVKLVLSSAELLETFMDKWRTAEALKLAGFPVPDSALPNQVGFDEFLERNKFPLMVKARKASGSQGNVRVRDRRELEFFCGYLPEPMVQAYLDADNEEYTIGVYRSPRSDYVDALVLRRTLAAGLTYKAECLKDAEVYELCVALGRKFDFFGPFNVQLRKTAHGPFVFEINPRLSTSAVMRARFGFNDAAMCVQDLVYAESLRPAEPKSGFAFRYWDEVYLRPTEVRAIEESGIVRREPENCKTAA